MANEPSNNKPQQNKQQWKEKLPKKLTVFELQKDAVATSTINDDHSNGELQKELTAAALTPDNGELQKESTAAVLTPDNGELQKESTAAVLTPDNGELQKESTAAVLTPDNGELQKESTTPGDGHADAEEKATPSSKVDGASNASLKNVLATSAKNQQQKPGAANRIKARVEKSRQKDKDEAEPQEIGGQPALISPGKKPQKYVVNLDPDMARIWKLHQDGIITRDDLVKILLIKVQQENEGQPAPILQILQERGWINQEQSQQLQTVLGTNVTHYGILPRSSQLDLVLGQQVIAHQLLSRIEVHSLLQVQQKLHLLGTQLSLETLFIASGLLPKDTLSFVSKKIANQMAIARAEAREIKQTEEQRRVLICNKPKVFPIALVVFLVLVVTIAVPLALLYLRVTEKRIARLNQAPTETVPQPKPSKQPSDPQPVPGPMTRKQHIPPRSPRSLDANAIQQLEQQQMKTQGLVQWGDYWISGQAHRMLARTWKIGKMANPFSYKPEIAGIVYELAGDKRQPILVIEGVMNGPQLPEEYRLKMVMELYHGLRTKAYTQKYFHSDKDNLWQVRMPLSARMAPGVYYLRIAAPNNLQNPFLQAFFNRQQQKIWWLPLQIGKKELIQRYYLFTRDNIDQLLKSLWQHFQKLSGLIGVEPSSLNQQQRWTSYRQELEQLDMKIVARSQAVLVPVFPDLEQRLLFFPKRLAQIVQLLQQEKNSEKLFSLRASFELEFYQARLALPRKYDQMLALLQIKNLRYVPYR